MQHTSLCRKQQATTQSPLLSQDKQHLRMLQVKYRGSCIKQDGVRMYHRYYLKRYIQVCLWCWSTAPRVCCSVGACQTHCINWKGMVWVCMMMPCMVWGSREAESWDGVLISSDVLLAMLSYRIGGHSLCGNWSHCKNHPYLSTKKDIYVMNDWRLSHWYEA